MTAGIFVKLDSVEIVPLLPPIPLDVLTDVVERLLQRIGADAEIGIGEHHACRIDISIESELHIKPFGDILHDIAHRPAILCLVCLRRGSQHQKRNGRYEDLSHLYVAKFGKNPEICKQFAIKDGRSALL